VLLSTLSSLACLVTLLPLRFAAVDGLASPSSTLWLRVRVRRPTGLCDWRSLEAFGGDEAWSRVTEDRAEVRPTDLGAILGTLTWGLLVQWGCRFEYYIPLFTAADATALFMKFGLAE